MSEEIKKNVIAYIASSSNYPAGKITDNLVLKDDPLNLDDTKLGTLTLKLRAYVKSLNKLETVLVKEIRQKGLTVKQTYELVIKKIES